MSYTHTDIMEYVRQLDEVLAVQFNIGLRATSINSFISEFYGYNGNFYLFEMFVRHDGKTILILRDETSRVIFKYSMQLDSVPTSQRLFNGLSRVLQPQY